MLHAFAPYIGCWEATDGSSRQHLAWGLDRKIVRTRMWFRNDDGWKPVSEGAFYRDPAADQIVGFASAIDMPVTHFAIVARATDDGLAFDNIAYTPDDSPMRSTERWHTDGSDRFRWQLFAHTGGGPTPWMDGEWKRLPAE